MNILDKVIIGLSPKWGAERLEWRNHLRNYDAGKTDRLSAGWVPVNTTAEQTDSMQRDLIRARARDLERNSDVAESIIGALERNVVGAGFTIQAKTDDDNLNNEIEDLFSQWKKPRCCDVTGQQSFDELVRMAVRRIEVDGALLFIKCYTSDGVVPFSLQAKEIDELDLTIGSKAINGNRIAGGIEFDVYNKPVAFYFRKYTPDGFYTAERERIPAKDVIYLYFKKRPSQIREMSQLARTLPRIRDMNEFIEAVSVKERVAACLAAFIKKVSPGGSGFGRAGGKTDDQSGLRSKTLTPGMIYELSPGEEVGTVNPPNTGNGLKDFMITHQRLSGAGQGLSYEVVSRDMSQVNYSSARQGLLEDQTTYKIWQNFLIDHFLSEVYTEFLISAALSGAIKFKSNFWKNKAEYLKHRWLSPGWSWIDPAKEAKANQMALDSNFDTLERICADRGLDWKAVLEQRAKENEVMVTLGLTQTTEPIDDSQQNQKSDDSEAQKENVQDSHILNGAQIQSMVLVIQSQKQGVVGYDAAIAILVYSLGFTEEQARKIIEKEGEESDNSEDSGKDDAGDGEDSSSTD